MRTFRTPAPWGIGPGPAKLYSIDGALGAVDMWLELTPVRPQTVRERDLMLTLRDLLQQFPVISIEADIISAKRAIKGMVKYARGREAQGARIASYAAHTHRPAHPSMAKS
ncbi:MAG TPA: hypothetical protein VJQ81_18500 [Reyranella sp.]|nr:hypothetical protein [Reyranella sp.]